MSSFMDYETSTKVEYGTCELQLSEFRPGKQFELLTARGKVCGHLQVCEYKLTRRPNLLEYLRAGWRFKSGVAIDFTLGNLVHTDLHSLHYLDSKSAN